METKAPGVTLGKLIDSGQLPSLDAKLAPAFSVMLTGEATRAIKHMKEQLALEGWLMKGRQILFEVYKNAQISDIEGLDFRDLLQVKLHNDRLLPSWPTGKTPLALCTCSHRTTCSRRCSTSRSAVRNQSVFSSHMMFASTWTTTSSWFRR